MPNTATDIVSELRRHARKLVQPTGDTPAVMLAAAAEIERLKEQIERASIACSHGDAALAKEILLATLEQTHQKATRIFKKHGERYESADGYILLREYESLTPNGNKMNGRWALRSPSAGLMDFDSSRNDIAERNNIKFE